MPVGQPPVAPQPVPQHQQQPMSRLRAKPEDSALHITVSDPVQHSEGINKYTSYRVDVRPQGQTDMATTQIFSAVLRRYSDFLWLFEKLHQERAGAIVPPLPDKQPVGRFSPQFVEDRRRGLERFIRRVSVHPELHDAACLETFLKADDVTFQAAKHAKGSAAAMSGSMMMPNRAQSQMMMPPPATTSTSKPGFKRWFAEAKTSISGDLVRSPDDELFEEIHRYVHGLDTQMKNVSQQATTLVRKGKEISNGLFEFGLAFNLLGQSEADALGDALSKMGETADRLSVLSAEHAEQETQQFDEPLVDTIKTIHSVKHALQKRHDKRLTYSTSLKEVESKQNQLAKLRAQMGQEAKAYGVEMSLRRSQEVAQTAQNDFAAVSQRVLREVDRFKREMAEDMRSVVLNYIHMQVEYNKRMEQIWATLIPKLEQVQLDQNSNVVENGAATAAAPVGSAAPAPGYAPPAAPPANQQQVPAASQQPQIHSQPMVPNPQAPMGAPAGGGLFGGPQAQTGELNLQYRQPPTQPL
eukprot:CAMPEP_0119555468 /NCGR_PEP_ID=MMETSP1352-20130426/7666_1 /TAXON_ID=265584 /ORGANISM="Stauroneis constricta, Strain CCMP1120" /LENGTH=524 /DNA_ID=CAMNT_0007602231 /DNA_START=350 /DNA_END=1927 /DNA_ORIENTATION=-